MLKLAAFAVVGKLLIYLGQKFPKTKLPIIGNLFQKGKFLEQLFVCDLCLGVWIYFFLALLMKISIVYELTAIPILSEFLTGTIVSFMVHLISIGWNEKFGTIVVN